MNDANAATTEERARQYIRDGLLETDRDMQHFSVAICRRLATGAPLTRRELADALGLAPTRIASMLDGYPATGIDFDANGAILAFSGLSLAKTAHEFVVAGRTLYTWCVLDALFLPEIIGQPAVLRTHCAASGERIEVHLEPKRLRSHRPEGVVMSIVGPDRQACRDNLRGDFCQHVLLFRDAAAFAEWSKDRDDVAAVSLAEGHALGAEGNASRYPDMEF
jgi:alkylmercury lyase